MRHYKCFFLAINIVLLCCLQADGKSKYYDGEDKPYEFGFNIEGEQHRHEKKDENGLIMGEFGFITADGVYHVTVYATDENGNFKIVSMKNIRVKPYPSGPGGAKKGASPERKGNSLPLPPAQPQPVTQRPPQPVAQRPQQPQPQKPLPIASPAKTCSHCSLPTTTTQAPRNQNYPANNFNTPSQNTPNQPNYGDQNRFNTPNTGFEAPAISGQQPGYNQQGGQPNQPNTYGNQPDSPNTGAGGQSNYASSRPGLQGDSQQGGFGSGPNYPQQGGGVQNYPQTGPQYSNPNSPPTGTGARNPKQYEQNANVGADQPYNPQGGFGGTLQSPLGPNKPTLVSANMQRVDSNTDVNKRGPGEKEGLPDKLNKNDMMLLLYTFNYTLGFHAHHEEGYTNGAKKGYYYVTGRNGIRTRVDYVADETGFHPKITQEVFDTLSEEVPKAETEKDEKYGLKGYEFKWIYYPVDSKLR